MLSNINPCLLIDIHHNNATIGTFYIAHSNEIMERKQKSQKDKCCGKSKNGGEGQDMLVIPCK